MIHTPLSCWKHFRKLCFNLNLFMIGISCLPVQVFVGSEFSSFQAEDDKKYSANYGFCFSAN